MKGLAWMASQAQRGTRQRFVTLRDVTLIAELERMMDRRGIEWSAEFEARCRAASLALFGVTAQDVRPPEPHLDQFEDRSATAHAFVSDDVLAAYDRALGKWYGWQEALREYDRQLGKVGIERFWRDRGVDVTDGAGNPLRCFRHFSLQMYVAQKGLLPAAKLTLDASGKRAPQSTDDWAATLERAAREFRPGAARSR